MKRLVPAAYAALLATLLATPLAHAQSTRDNEIAELRAEIAALTARLDALEETRPVEREVVQAASPARAEWPDRVRLSGDMRYRHETINEEGGVERNRQRIRARVGLTADVSDDLTVGLTLSTGNDDPISGNQTLGDGFSRKSIGVDRAFFAWDVTDKLAIRGGKMGNPLFRPGGHPLIYDGDLNPEGLALTYESGSFFGNFAGFAVEERSSTDDSVLMAAQAGYRGDIGRNLGLTVGVSVYDYRRTRGRTPFFDGEAAGNTLDGTGGYLYDYDLVELFAEAEVDVGGEPLRFFADYVENTAADMLDTGYAVGIRWRRASQPGTWDLAWAYEDLEADAVIATFTDSDYAGGGTDGKGHVFRTNYVFRDRWNLGLTYFLNERGMATGNQHDYKRLQADVSFRY